MAQITINGVKYPLCLTVAVLDDLEERGLRLADIDTLYTTGEGRDVQDTIENSLWLLGKLMLQGACYAENNGAADVPTPLPLAVLRCSLTPGDVLHTVIPAVCAAIAEGMGRRIEAAHDAKKADAEFPSP